MKEPVGSNNGINFINPKGRHTQFHRGATLEDIYTMLYTIYLKLQDIEGVCNGKRLTNDTGPHKVHSAATNKKGPCEHNDQKKEKVT
jgi:hypothetical protein